MADAAVVGILRAMLTADTAQFDAGMRKAASTSKTTEKAIGGLGNEVKKLTPQAERMVKAFQGDKLLYQANNLVQAVTKLGGASKLTDTEMRRMNATLDAALAKYKALGVAAPKALTDLSQATRQSLPLTTQLSSSLGLSGAAAIGSASAMGILVRTLGAYVGAGALVGAIKTTIRYANELDKSAIALDTTATAVQRLENIAVAGNTTLSAMTGAITMMQDRLAGGDASAVAALKELGLTVNQVFALHPDQQFILIAKALQEIQSQEQRIRLGKDIFGRGAVEIMGALRTNIDAASDSIRIMSDTNTGLLGDLAQAWDRAYVAGKRYVGFAMTTAVNPLGAMAPTVAGLPRAPNMGLKLPEGLPSRALDDAAIARATANLTDHVAALRAAQAELRNLNSAERQQIAAAIERGVRTEDLTDMVVRFGVSEHNAEVAIRLVTAAMKDAEAESKRLAKAQEELAKQTEEANRRWLDILGAIEVAEMRRQRSTLDIQGNLQQQMIPEASVDDAIAELQRLERAESEWRQFQNELGERAMQDERRRMDAMKAFRERYLMQFTQSLMNIGEAATSNLFSMFFGGDDGGRAKQAKEEYEQLKKSGTASAEAITRAFRTMREEQHSFFDRFKGWTSSLLSAFKGLVDDMLGMWVREFIGGIMRSLMRSKLGQSITNALLNLGGGAAGGAGGLFGTGGNIAMSALGIGGGSGLIGASAAPSVASLLGAAPAGAAGGVAAGGAGGAGIGATIGALATNPITVGAAAVLALWASGALSGGAGAGRRMDAWKRGDRSGAGASDFLGRIHRDTFRAVAGKNSFSMGGFVPPNVTMPAILHGGTYGEDIVPRRNHSEGQFNRGTRIEVHNHISAIDDRGVREFVGSKAFTDSVSRAFEDNKNFIGSRVGRSLKP